VVRIRVTLDDASAKGIEGGQGGEGPNLGGQNLRSQKVYSGGWSRSDKGREGGNGYKLKRGRKGKGKGKKGQARLPQAAVRDWWGDGKQSDEKLDWFSRYESEVEVSRGGKVADVLEFGLWVGKGQN
jgi:hypothetical protein